MSTGGRDDDALSWAGDDDPTLRAGKDAPSAPEAEKAHPPIFKPPPPAEVRRDTRPVRVVETTDEDAVGLGNAGLVGVGMLAAAFLLFALGWLIAGLRLQAVGVFSVPVLAALTIAAALAPIAWFATVMLLTRGRRSWVRFVWLIAGVLLLVPWPFLATGSFA